MPPPISISPRPLPALALIVAVLLAAAPLHHVGAQVWGENGVTVYQLGSGIGASQSASAINNLGQVAGWSSPDGRARILSPNGNGTQLGTLGGASSWGMGVNDAGWMAGYSSTPQGGPIHAFLYNDGVMQDLSTLGGPYSWAFGVNNSGEVAGYSTTNGNVATHAFRYSSGVMQDLGTLGGKDSFATDINDAGGVVGYSYISNGLWHAFLYDDLAGGMLDLGTLGGTRSEAYGINNAGQVVGNSYTASNAASHAFLYSGGMMQDLGTVGGTSSRANDIDNTGRVVGAGSDSNGLFEAALWADDGSGYGAYSLANLVNDGVNNTGWTFSTAASISDNGRFILAQGSNGTDYSGWTVLEARLGSTPTVTPEPATVLLLGSGLAALAAMQRRRRRKLTEVA